MPVVRGVLVAAIVAVSAGNLTAAQSRRCADLMPDAEALKATGLRGVKLGREMTLPTGTLSCSYVGDQGYPFTFQLMTGAEVQKRTDATRKAGSLGLKYEAVPNLGNAAWIDPSNALWVDAGAFGVFVTGAATGDEGSAGHKDRLKAIARVVLSRAGATK